MKINIALIGYLLLSGLLDAQNTCLSDFTYNGPPGDIFEDSSGVIPNSVLEIKFCAMNVADRLVLIFCKDTLSFYVGKTNFPPRSDYVKGYIEFYYKNDTIFSITKPNPSVNTGSECDYSSGAITIFLTVPADCCKLYWRIEGNLDTETRYFFCLKKISDPDNIAMVLDSSIIYHCGPTQIKYSLDSNCQLHYIKYINVELMYPKINNPTCALSEDGSILFPIYFTKYNITNAAAGQYQIHISENGCIVDYDITLDPAGLCAIYIPNVVSANWDGVNDTFDISCDGDYEYEIFIYDRWGGLLHRGQYMTNATGWRPDDTLSIGVYAYQIRILNSTFSGDVTVLH